MRNAQLTDALDQRLVLAHRDAEFVARVKRCLNRLGWEVYLAKSGARAMHLAHKLSPAVVVLDTELPDESGWLVCKKLTAQQPDLRVILVGNERGPEQVRFAHFVGAAALVLRQEGVASLAHEVLGLAPSVWR
jgi:DNA-binding response OmpR family regulator